MNYRGDKSMIRHALLSDVYDRLMVNKAFRIEDFRVSQHEREHPLTTDVNDVVMINYVYSEDYYFEIEFYSDVDTVLARYRPGRARMEETASYSIKDLRGCFFEIVSWTERIESELAALPLLRRMEEQRQRVEKIEKSIEQIPNEYLTREEARELISRLDRLEKQIIENISEDRDDDVFLAEELKAARSDIERLKCQVDQLTKKNWIRAFLARSMDWAEAHPKTIGMALSAVSHLVSPHQLSSIGTSSPPNELIAATEEHDA